MYFATFSLIVSFISWVCSVLFVTYVYPCNYLPLSSINQKEKYKTIITITITIITILVIIMKACISGDSGGDFRGGDGGGGGSDFRYQRRSASLQTTPSSTPLDTVKLCV